MVRPTTKGSGSDSDTTVKKRLTSVTKDKPPTREELIQRKKDAVKLYSKLSLSRNQKPPAAPPKVATIKPEPRPTKPTFTSRPAPSATRSVRPSPSTSKVDFQPMSSSLMAIKSGFDSAPTTGRISMLKLKKRAEAPRPSLLPFGINIFDKNTSEADKLKVKEFMNNRSKRAESDSESDAPYAATPATLNRRNIVRFQRDDVIQEMRESGGDDLLTESQPVVVPKEPQTLVKEPQSILKKRPRRSTAKSSASLPPRPPRPAMVIPSPIAPAERPVYASFRFNSSIVDCPAEASSTVLKPAPIPFRLDSTSSDESSAPVDAAPSAPSPSRQRPPRRQSGSNNKKKRSSTKDMSTLDDMDGQQLYTYIFNNNDKLAGLSAVMLSDLMALMKDNMIIAQRREAQQPPLDETNTSMKENLMTPPVAKKPKKACKSRSTGFRTYTKEDLIAAQEALLFNNKGNSSAVPDEKECPVLRARSDNPIADGASPFPPLSTSATRSTRSSAARGLFQ